MSESLPASERGEGKGGWNDIVLTSAKNNDIAPNDRTLAVAITKKVRRAFYSEAKKKRSDTDEENQKTRRERVSYNPMGKNWLMPPKIMTPPTARLTSRLCNSVISAISV